MARRTSNIKKIRLRLQSYVTEANYDYLLRVCGDPYEPDKFAYGALGEYFDELISKERKAREKKSEEVLDGI